MILRFEPLYRRALGIFEDSLGADHPSTVTVRENQEIFMEEYRKWNKED